MRRKYAPFASGLCAGVAKVEEYYNKTAASHAYTFVMGKFASYLVIGVLC